MNNRISLFETCSVYVKRGENCRLQCPSIMHLYCNVGYVNARDRFHNQPLQNLLFSYARGEKMSGANVAILLFISKLNVFRSH